MTGDFDAFLGRALAPPERDPDAEFVLRVRALCALDARLRGERRALVRTGLTQGLGLVALAAGLLWLGRADSVAAFFASSPGIALGAMLAGFVLLVTTMTAPSHSATRAA